MNGLTEVDAEVFMDSKQSEADKALLVRFFTKPMKDAAATLAEGRPIFKETEYIEIRIPGERDAAACRPASLADAKRFPEHYAAFKSRIAGAQEIGTPLSEWPMITRSQAEELAFFSIKTVEQLVGMPDSSNHNFKSIVGLKQKAAEWLNKNKDKTELETYFRKREEALNQRLEEQAQQIKELMAAVKNQSVAPVSSSSATEEVSRATSEPAPAKAKARGRPKKIVEHDSTAHSNS